MDQTYRLIGMVGSPYSMKMRAIMRYRRQEDQDYCSKWLVHLMFGPDSQDAMMNIADIFKQRQVSRLELVGCNESTRPLIEESYRQGTFRYQGKCLTWLREEYAELEGDAKERMDAALKKTGCWQPLQK